MKNHIIQYASIFICIYFSNFSLAIGAQEKPFGYLTLIPDDQTEISSTCNPSAQKTFYSYKTNYDFGKNPPKSITIKGSKKTHSGPKSFIHKGYGNGTQSFYGTKISYQTTNDVISISKKIHSILGFPLQAVVFISMIGIPVIILLFFLQNISTPIKAFLGFIELVKESIRGFLRLISKNKLLITFVVVPYVVLIMIAGQFSGTEKIVIDNNSTIDFDITINNKETIKLPPRSYVIISASGPKVEFKAHANEKLIETAVLQTTPNIITQIPRMLDSQDQFIYNVCGKGIYNFKYVNYQ